MTYLIFIALSAVFNAVMDGVENENFHESRILRDLNPRFWYKRESWKYCRKIFGYHVDAWHIAKSLMIICVAAAVLCCIRNNVADKWLLIVHFLLIGIVWNSTFKLFYHQILGIK